VLEVWSRPSRTVRQSVVRVTVRRDGKAFVQARAGLACCEPGVARRVDIDAELPAAAIGPLRALADDPLWKAPRDVGVFDGEGGVNAICVDGTAYDLTRLTAGSAVSLRRACDPAEVGQAAAVLTGILGQALGHDPRFDILFPDQATFTSEAEAYRALIAGGGALRPAPKP
jgi:hypothetical protein